MDYYLFIDESGVPGFKVGENPPLFTLCGAIMSSAEHALMCPKMDEIKKGIWGTKKIVLHSSEIALKQKEFSVFEDSVVFAGFIRDMNQLISETDFKVLSCTIKKDKYAPGRYPNVHRIYGLCLELIIERTIHFLRQVEDSSTRLRIIVERRGIKEDRILQSSFDQLIKNGNSFWRPAEFQHFFPDIHFRYKRDNLHGLQIVDSCAFPIKRFHHDEKRPHPTFPYVEPKIYCVEGNCSSYGLKCYP